MEVLRYTRCAQYREARITDLTKGIRCGLVLFRYLSVDGSISLRGDSSTRIFESSGINSCSVD